MTYPVDEYNEDFEQALAEDLDEIIGYDGFGAPLYAQEIPAKGQE